MSLNTIQKLSISALFAFTGVSVFTGCAGPTVNQAPVTIRETLPMTQNDSSIKLMSACNTAVTSVQMLDNDLVPCLMDSDLCKTDQMTKHIQEALQTVSYQKQILQGTRAAAVLESNFNDAIQTMTDLEETLSELNQLISSGQTNSTLIDSHYQQISRSINELKRLSTAF